MDLLVPAEPGAGLPTVIGVVLLNDAETSEPLLVLDAGAVTALRTGAVAAVASTGARDGGRAHGRASSAAGVNGAWTARCLAAAGFTDGVVTDPRAEAAEALAAELGLAGRDPRRRARRRTR